MIIYINNKNPLLTVYECLNIQSREGLLLLIIKKKQPKGC